MKRFFSISLLLQAVTGLMTLSLAAIFALHALSALKSQEQAGRVPEILGISSDLFASIQNLRTERGNVFTALSTPDVAGADSSREIERLREASRKGLNAALQRLGSISLSKSVPTIEEIRERRQILEQLRKEADEAMQKPLPQRPKDITARWVAGYISLADAIDRLSIQLESELAQNDAFTADMVRIKEIAWAVRADTGRDRFRLATALTGGTQMSEAARLSYSVLGGRIDGAWKVVQDRAMLPDAPERLSDAVKTADELYFKKIRQTHDMLLDELTEGQAPSMRADEWLAFAAPGEEAIFSVGNIALDIARDNSLDEFMVEKSRFYGAILLMLLFCGIGLATSWYVLKGVVHPINRITETMRQLADGNLACAIPDEHRVDEIGSLARGLRVFRDNAIEKRRLRIEKDGAEAANRMKSEILANVSHELRTPLNAIIGFSEVISNEVFGPVSDRYRGYAADIFKSGTHLLGLINDILDLSKLEAGRLELIDEEVDLRTAVDACVTLVYAPAQRAHIRISVSLDRSATRLRADDRRMRQVLINLLSNAVKFTPDGGEVRITSVRTKGGLALSVSDTGIGMAPEDIPKALTTFGQVDSKISRKHEGTGLGLPLTKHLVEMHGGSLSIDSTVNVGTTVTIVLPASRILPASAPVCVSA